MTIHTVKYRSSKCIFSSRNKCQGALSHEMLLSKWSERNDRRGWVNLVKVTATSLEHCIQKVSGNKNNLFSSVLGYGLVQSIVFRPRNSNFHHSAPLKLEHLGFHGADYCITAGLIRSLPKCATNWLVKLHFRSIQLSCNCAEVAPIISEMCEWMASECRIEALLFRRCYH